MTGRPIRAVVAAAATALLTSGCGGFAGLSDVPLPGGPDLGSDPRRVTVEAQDVLNLSRQASVKVDDVTVGEVESVERDGWQARVVVRIRGDVDLPANAVAAIRQTGLLGEKYVELAPPADIQPVGQLEDGATIGIDRTSRSSEVEEVLGALSLLLNGGGLDRLRTITVELNQALGGRQEEFRALLSKLTSFTGTLAANKESIVDAIEGLDRLSARAASGRRTIARALDTLGPALTVLADQRRQLVRMLDATSRLARVTTSTVARTRADLLADLDLLAPVLSRLAEGAETLPDALEYALTFPFPTKGLQALKGDYFNFDLEVRVGELRLLQLLGLKPSAPVATPPAPAGPTAPDTLAGLLTALLGGGD
ncbi:MAG TPA: MCE family protein [Nocardioidaceae bacterium]|nr:MCE family protein [Nocardioidaceae bacterium]